MVPRLVDWTNETLRRRGEVGAPFHPAVVAPGPLSGEPVSRAAAAAVAGYLAPRPVSVSFSAGGSYADIETGRVNLDPSALETAGSSDEALEELVGLAAHEGGHQLYTEALPRRVSRLYRWIHNIIEDERIERLLATECPALSHPLEQARRRLLQTDRRLELALEAFFALVRVPAQMPPDLWRAHEGFLRKAMEALTPFPQTSRGVRRATRRVMRLLPKAERRLAAELFELVPCRCGHSDAEREGRRWDVRVSGTVRTPRWIDHPGRVDAYPSVEWAEARPDPSGYEQVRRQVMRDAQIYADAFRAWLPPRTVPLRRRGRLERRRLHAWPYDERLFRHAGEHDETMALALIIDLSGSMRGRSVRVAKRVAIGLAEGAAMLRGMRLYVYGHTADANGGSNTQILRFATPAQGRVTTLGRLPIGFNNRDAHAIDAIRADLLERDGARRGLRSAFVICDGMPAANGFSGEAAVDATRCSLAAFERAWGPAVLVLTQTSERLERLMPGRHLLFEEGNPAPVLMRELASKLGR